MPSTFGAGLICGFRLGQTSACDDDVLDSLDPAEPVWLHFNLSDKRAREWLSRHPHVSDDAREVLLGTDARTHVEVHDGGIAAVLGDLHHDFDGDPERLGSLRLYVGRRWLLSGRTHPLRAVDVLRRELAKGQELETTLALFERVIELLAASFGGVVTSLAEQVDDAEDRILTRHFRQERTRLGNLRRLVARLRRLVGANRAALSSLPASVPGLYDFEQRQQLRTASERLEAVGQDLELVQERARLLQEEIAARMSEATSRNLFVLSIATTTLLPITLITGIFGMNVPGLPFADDAHGFQWVMLVIAFTVVVALALLRRIGAL